MNDRRLIVFAAGMTEESPLGPFANCRANKVGHLFRVTSGGESLGPVIGVTVDGCPPGFAALARQARAGSE